MEIQGKRRQWLGPGWEQRRWWGGARFWISFQGGAQRISWRVGCGVREKKRKWARLGPVTLCCSACTWTNVSWSNKIQINYKGLKITVCMCSWGKLWTKYKKRPKSPTAALEEPGAKAGHCACPLHTAPPKAWADHLSHPSGPTPGHTPTLTPYKKQACPLLSEQASKRTCGLFLLPPAAAPIKPCLNFLSGFWSISTA